MKRWAIVVLIALTTLAFTAIPAAAQDEGYALTVWKFGGVRIEKAFAVTRANEWNTLHPDMKVKWVEYDWGARTEKIVSALSNGRLPDIIVVDTQSIPDFANMGVIKAISDLDASYVAKWKKLFVPEAFDLGYYEGKYYGFSTYVDIATFLAYNTEQVRKAGLVDEEGDATPPRTWDELISYCKKIQSKGRMAIALSCTQNVCDVNMLEGIAYANGGRWLDEKGNIAVNQAGFVDALRLYKTLSEYALPGFIESNYRDNAVQFFNKQAAMYPALSWVGVFNTELQVPVDFSYRMTVFPTNPKPTGRFTPVSGIMTGTFCPMITTNCKNNAVALKFVDFWTEDKSLLAWDGSVQFGRVPTGVVAWKGKSIGKYWPDLKKKYDEGTLFRGVQPMPAFPGLSSGQTYLAEAMQEVLLGVSEPQAALDRVATKLKAVMKK